MDEINTPIEEKRRYYRVEYPPSLRPILKIRKHQFEVLDISEKGIKFLTGEKIKFGRWVSGRVTFYDGETLPIEGKIVREHENNIGLFLTIKAIPYSKILSEQRLLARLHPDGNLSGG